MMTFREWDSTMEEELLQTDGDWFIEINKYPQTEEELISIISNLKGINYEELINDSFVEIYETKEEIAKLANKIGVKSNQINEVILNFNYRNA